MVNFKMPRGPNSLVGNAPKPEERDGEYVSKKALRSAAGSVSFASWRTRRRTAPRACTPRVLSSRTRTTEASCSSCSRREATACSARAPRLPSTRAPPGASRFPRNSASTSTWRRTRPLRSKRSSLRLTPRRTCSTSSWRSAAAPRGVPVGEAWAVRRGRGRGRRRRRLRRRLRRRRRLFRGFR